VEAHGRTHSIEVDLPPLAVLILKAPTAGLQFPRVEE
jgi:hypothetical protein